jgi:hypothetical protein
LNARIHPPPAKKHPPGGTFAPRCRKRGENRHF